MHNGDENIKWGFTTTKKIKGKKEYENISLLEGKRQLSVVETFVLCVSGRDMPESVWIKKEKKIVSTV